MPDIYQDCTQTQICSILLGFRTTGRANSPMGSRPWCQTPCSGVCWHGLRDPGLEAAQPAWHAADECLCCSSCKEREQHCTCELETQPHHCCTRPHPQRGELQGRTLQSTKAMLQFLLSRRWLASFITQLLPEIGMFTNPSPNLLGWQQSITSSNRVKIQKCNKPPAHQWDLCHSYWSQLTESILTHALPILCSRA